MAIKQRPDENLESMLRRFKKEVLKAGIMEDLRKHEYYVAPAERRRLKDAAAMRRLKKKSKD